MNIVEEVLVYVVGIPIALGFCWLAGLMVRSGIFKEKGNIDERNFFGQSLINITIGAIALIILGTVLKQLGCFSESDLFMRRM